MDERNEKDIVNPEEYSEKEHSRLETPPEDVEAIQPESIGSETASAGSGAADSPDRQQDSSARGQSGQPNTPPPGYGNYKNSWQGAPPPGYGYAPGGYNPYHGPRKSNNMALASLLLGILSVVLCCCGGFGVILGAVGIVLAILSRGSEPMETSAKVGLGLSIGGIVLGIAILAMSFAVAGSEQFRDELNRGGYGNYESYKHYFEHGGL